MNNYPPAPRRRGNTAIILLIVQVGVYLVAGVIGAGVAMSADVSSGTRSDKSFVVDTAFALTGVGGTLVLLAGIIAVIARAQHPKIRVVPIVGIATHVVLALAAIVVFNVVL
ncbi:hypothetical protein [Williamsia sp. CHRR-6]|uniref:hypothetical protein n=1 Tax=Williamsia sp. CHRR-6 TaxID=2835871 RepID=UPI001BDB1D82|nr:hypothetical protein [Williamsia sp. CHRR-6]MBT0568541.1 hypothetical protein [Williamsia sp. CHRR-6]